MGKKEFNFVRIDPYWKIRFYCYALGLNIFGDKADLLRRINDMLFLHENIKKPTIDPEAFDIDIEVLAKNFKFSTGKYDNISTKQLESKLTKGNFLKNPTKKLL